MRLGDAGPKTRFKRLLQRARRASTPPLIVASMGRSGSTLIWDALRHASVANSSPKILSTLKLRLASDVAWDLSRTKFMPGVVYKTHGLAHEMPNQTGARVVFLFGSATDAALSVLSCHERYGTTWIEQHFKHLRASGSLSEIAERDVLRFEEQIDGWIGKAGTDRMILNYDAVWDHADELANFVGMPLSLPLRRPRSGSASVDASTRSRVAKNYTALDARIAALPTCQVLT